MKKNLLLALFALGVSACGNPLLFAQVDEPKVCFQMAGESIPAAPGGLDGSVSWNGQFDLSAVPGLGKSGTTGSISMLYFEVDSSTDMSGISNVVVDLPSVTSGHYIDYTQTTPATHANSIVMTPAQDVNLLSAVTSGGSLPYSITFTGSPPAVAWQADMSVCLKVSVEVDVLKSSH